MKDAQQKKWTLQEQAEVQGLLDRAAYMTNFSATNYTKASPPTVQARGGALHASDSLMIIPHYVNRLAECGVEGRSDACFAGKASAVVAPSASYREGGSSGGGMGATGAEAAVLLVVGAGLFGSVALCLGAAVLGRWLLKKAEGRLGRKPPVLQICSPAGLRSEPAQLAEQCFLGRGGPVCERSDCYCKRKYGDPVSALPAKQAPVSCTYPDCGPMTCDCPWKFSK